MFLPLEVPQVRRGGLQQPIRLALSGAAEKLETGLRFLLR